MAHLISQLEPPSYLLPTKFLLIMAQILLLSLVLYLRTNFLYWGIGAAVSSVQGTSAYLSAESTLVGVTVCFIIFLAFEVLLLILGISLMFNQVNMVQIFLHVLGCLFTTWFILDNWNYTYIWPLWACFGLVPFLFEFGIVIAAVVFSNNIAKNR